MARLLRVKYLVVLILGLMGASVLLYILNDGYQEKAKQRERHIIPFVFIMSDEGIEEGDTLEEVLLKSPVSSYGEMLLNNYTSHQARNRDLSEFLTLTWEGEKGFKSWKIAERLAHKVSLFEQDRLMISSVKGLQWLSGRELLSDGAKAIYLNR